MSGIAPVAKTGFGHRLTAYKIVGNFFGLSYRKISRSIKVFLESVTFQFHSRMLISEVAQPLKSYGHFSNLGLGSGSLSATTIMVFSGKANYTSLSIHGLGEDDTAMSGITLMSSSTNTCWRSDEATSGIHSSSQTPG